MIYTLLIARQLWSRHLPWCHAQRRALRVRAYRLRNQHRSTVLSCLWLIIYPCVTGPGSFRRKNRLYQTVNSSTATSCTGPIRTHVVLESFERKLFCSNVTPIKVMQRLSKRSNVSQSKIDSFVMLASDKLKGRRTVPDVIQD